MELVRDSLWLILIVGGPALAIALIVGVVISLLQALTQVQEMTLTFVPKIVCMFIGLVVAMPFMLDAMRGFMTGIADRIAAGGP